MSALLPDAAAEKAMTFREHLRELRSRLVRIVLALTIGFFICWEYRLPLFEFLSRPIADALADNGIYQFRAMQLTESVVVYLKTSLLADLFFLSPYVFYELWGFIAPGLYAREKRFVLPLTGFSVFFFVVGAAFAYLILLPFVTDWLVALTLEGGQVDVMVTIANTYSFAFMFLLMFGLVFELPLVIFFLALWGMVTGKGLLKFWRYFVVISFIVSGILTPPDPLSQIFMAIPLNILYGLGVIIAYAVSRARAKDDPNAGRHAIRALGLSVLGATAAVAGLLVLLRGLPQKALTDLAPDDTALAVGFNPKVVLAERAVVALLRDNARIAATLTALEAGGADFDAMSEGLWFRTAAGHEGLLLRGQATEGRSDQNLGAAMVVTALDEDTLYVGSPAARAQLADGQVRALDDGDGHARVLRRVSKYGPVWAWLPTESPLRPKLLGDENSRELGPVGVSLALSAPRQLFIDIPLTTEALAAGIDDRVSARIEAARVQSLARFGDREEQQLVEVVVALADELARDADPGRRTRAEGLKTRAEALRTVARTDGADSFPALLMLAEDLRGVSVRADENRLQVSAEIADTALGTLVLALSNEGATR